MSRYVVHATWDDAPHLDEATKADLLRSIQPFQRDARTKGVPQLGAGAVYQVAESEIVVPGFPIPKHFRRGYGMDAGGGAKPTAAVFFALDPDAHVLYVYDCYKRSAAEPVIHAEAIKARGLWIPGVADAAALIMLAHDVEQLIQTYQKLGLDIVLPDKAVETGIQEVWELLSTGRLKVFTSCAAWLQEYRLYRRDEHGRIVKENDHLMDGSRYLVHSGRPRMKVQPAPKRPAPPVVHRGPTAWMS